MTQERQANSLESLTQTRQNLSRVIDQRQQLIDSLNARLGRPGIENAITDLRITDEVLPKVKTSVQRIQDRISQVEEEINQQSGSLVAQAQEFLDRLAIYEQVIIDLRNRAQNSRYPLELLEKRETEFQTFSSRVQTDTELKRGIEFLKQRQEQEKAEEKKEEKPKPQEQVPVQIEEEKILPLLRISEQKSEIQLEGWEKPKKVHGIRRAVLIELAKSANQFISNQTLREIAINQGSKDDNPVGIAISGLRSIIEPDPKNPQIIVKRGAAKQAAYCLNAEVIFEDEEKAKPERSQKGKEARQVFEFTLPDGQVVQIMGKYKAKTLEKLLAGFKENRLIETDELALTLYGVYNRKTYTLTQQFVARLRKDLQPVNWRIIQPVSPPERARGKKATYYLERVQVEEKPPETTHEVEITPSEEEGIETGPIPKSPSASENIIELPYVPSEEETRSEEETQILNVIVSLISANFYNPRIRFDDIISGLSPQIQRKSRLAPEGKRYYPVYSAVELRDKFASALRKLREEEAIPHLKEFWTEEEQRLWGRIKLAVDKISYGDFEDFERKVKREIDRSIGQFYREHPPSAGEGRIGWIEA